jgi:hypothetical protein
MTAKTAEKSVVDRMSARTKEIVARRKVGLARINVIASRKKFGMVSEANKARG